MIDTTKLRGIGHHYQSQYPYRMECKVCGDKEVAHPTPAELEAADAIDTLRARVAELEAERDAARKAALDELWLKAQNEVEGNDVPQFQGIRQAYLFVRSFLEEHGAMGLSRDQKDSSVGLGGGPKEDDMSKTIEELEEKE